MVKLTKAIIRKYGISKKAWAVARSKSRGRSRSVKRARVTSRSVKRASRRRVSTKSRGTRKMSKGLGRYGKRIAQGVGAGLAGSASGLLSTVGVNLSDDFASLAIGTVLDMNTKGFIKAGGQGMQIAGIAQLTSGLTSGLLGRRSGGSGGQVA